MRSPQETRTVHYVCKVLFDRLEQTRVFAWIILQVGVLDEHHIAGGSRNGRAHRGALALVALVQNDTHLRVVFESLEKIAGAIRGTIINDDNFRRNANGFDALHNLSNRFNFVINRHED